MAPADYGGNGRKRMIFKQKSRAAAAFAFQLQHGT
jgi:hypothetical protein